MHGTLVGKRLRLAGLGRPDSGLGLCRSSLLQLRLQLRHYHHHHHHQQQKTSTTTTQISAVHIACLSEGARNNKRRGGRRSMDLGRTTCQSSFSTSSSSTGEGGEDPANLDRVAQLRASLDEAIEQEDYSKAASIRDEIKRFTAIVDVQIAEANDRFYKAFESGRLADMKRVWGEGKHVRVIHPGAACIVGREQVMKSWEHIFQVGGYKIDVEEVEVHAIGGKCALVTCIEYVDSGPTVGKIIATNIFEKQDSEWKIIHHHGSQAALQ